MGKLFDSYDAVPVKGVDITIGEIFPEIFISDKDEILCYLGICLCEPHLRNDPFSQPYYMQGKHSKDSSISGEIKGFYRLIDGCIVLDCYVDDAIRKNRSYKKIDAIVGFSGYKKDYAVCVNDDEDDALTCGVFGLTCDELDHILRVYTETLGFKYGYYSYPVLSKSRKYQHFCDMMNLWIPEQFPYVAFADDGFDLSHVSLFGFYRYMQLLTGCSMDSPFSKMLLDSGISQEVLTRLFDVGSGIYYQKKVTKDTLLTP